MDKIQLQANVPVDLALQYPDGKEVASQFGPGKQVMFLTLEGKALYLSQYAASKIQALNLQPGQPFRLTKVAVDNGHSKTTDWKAELLPGEQGDGTFAVGKPPVEPPPQRCSNGGTPPASNGSNHTPFPDSPYEHSGSSLRLRETVNMLIDVEASCIEYAKKYSGAIRNEDVRALLISTYINQSKGMRL